MAPTRHTPLALMFVFGLACFCVGVGCRTQYGPLVGPLPPQPVAPAIVEVGKVSVSKRKFGFCHQPSFSRDEMANLANGALRRATNADFFSEQSVDAVLKICPTARLPIWYSLRIEFSGVTARTNRSEVKAGPR